ncbi:hypothetical protein [Streptomyces sp. NPDC051561]|uniref:hypothetical protein n=1 Tax=Streptomyces sp. NPDC051561 TaxID=3365658 RepID=UPI0037ABC1A5
MNWVATVKDRLRAFVECVSRWDREPVDEAIRIEYPAPGAHWQCADRCLVQWQVSGPLAYPCRVVLERPTDHGWAAVAVLANAVDPRARQVAVAVPEVPRGMYRVRIASPELTTAAYSEPLSLSD